MQPDKDVLHGGKKKKPTLLIFENFCNRTFHTSRKSRRYRDANQILREECNIDNALDYQPNGKHIMELIKQNPYHIIGILAGANQRTISKQKAKINAFQKIGRSIEFDNDLEFTGNPDRSKGAIETSFANIEINQNKIFHALFWFANKNHLDETALTYLQSGNVEKAEEIWQKVITGKKVSSNNYTAFNNLGTLKLSIAFNNDMIDVDNLKEAVRLKVELLTSDCFNEFCYLVADETYTVNKDKELESFINALLEEVQKTNSTEANKIPSLIGNIHPKVKSLVYEKLTATPLHNIERKIEQTKKQRVESPENALQLARVLYRDTKSDFTTLAELLGKDDLNYKMTADKLAKELLQCGIDYFNEYREDEDLHEGDLGHDVMLLFKKAKSIAVGIQTKERINENIEGLQEWIDNADVRRIKELISDDLAFIYKKLERFQELADSIENANDLVTSCKPKLQNIKNVFGADDDFYLKISSAVVNNALRMLVTVINEAQQDLMVKLLSLNGLIEKVREAIIVSDKLGSLDMVSELRNQYNKNQNTLKLILSRLNSASERPSRSYSGNGCYIATMAYGSYEHPQVLELRKFRDEFMSRSFAGRGFINVYYWLSPKLVKILEGHSWINFIIRKILDQFIRLKK